MTKNLMRSLDQQSTTAKARCMHFIIGGRNRALIAANPALRLDFPASDSLALPTPEETTL